MPLTNCYLLTAVPSSSLRHRAIPASGRPDATSDSRPQPHSLLCPNSNYYVCSRCVLRRLAMAPSGITGQEGRAVVSSGDRGRVVD